ncbi:MAG: DNA repair protein RecN [Kiritimatiellae bacterium]|nr:DNA repair protein RecN [Kiritimatiellia bacterium]
MLETLRIKNLAIVENIRVDFGRGLNVITGETGAGKSVIVGALGLVLGERADRSLIRAGEDQCGVEAIFNLSDPSAIDAELEELGIDACEEGKLIIRRIVFSSGSGKNLVNDCPTTVQAFKRLGDFLVDMHGPHDHQSLLNREFQLDSLDAFGHLNTPRAVYEELYIEMLGLENEKHALDGDDSDVAQQIDMLAFQIKEIEDADLDDCREEDLEQEHNVATNAQRILELASEIINFLAEGDMCAVNSVTSARNALVDFEKIVSEAETWRQDAESISVQIQELSSTVTDYIQNVDGDPERLQWLEDRMTMLHKMKRKYGSSVEEIQGFLEKARGRLAKLESRGEQIVLLDAKLLKLRKRVQAAGKDLGSARRKTAVDLAQAITEELRGLGFAHGVFDVALEDVEPGPSGLDQAEFGFAPNVGEPMRPLRAIASSGEISRVMLALKAVLAMHDRIPVLVFDEIDSNIGGEMGNAVGQKLRAVAKHHQVLCITHLPQVAVHGSMHHVVEKTVQDGRTRTTIVNVADDARVGEVARMLGGRDMTSVTLRHAKEMLTIEL